MSYLTALLTVREPINAWSHGLWFVLSLPATFLLWRRCDGDRAKQFSLLVFGVSLAICYAGSMLFHAVRLPKLWIDRFDALDHVGIFILIAGTYTPVAWNLLDGRFRWGTLTAVWLASALGSLLFVACGGFSMFWSTCFYMAMGWGSTICYVEMARTLSHRTLFPLLFGGILYTAGAVINLTGWPVFWPSVMGTHELFHLFVMAGSLCHFWFMLDVVVPSIDAAPACARPEAGSLVDATRRAPAADRFPDPSTAKGYSQPRFLHASPHWGRGQGD